MPGLRIVSRFVQLELTNNGRVRQQKREGSARDFISCMPTTAAGTLKN